MCIISYVYNADMSLTLVKPGSLQKRISLNEHKSNGKAAIVIQNLNFKGESYFHFQLNLPTLPSIQYFTMKFSHIP